MCDQHLLDRHAMVLRTLQQAFGLAAGIDQRAAHRRVVPDQRTILLERGNRNNFAAQAHVRDTDKSEEHTSELQSLMRISYAVFCLKKKKTNNEQQLTNTYKQEIS